MTKLCGNLKVLRDYSRAVTGGDVILHPDDISKDDKIIVAVVPKTKHAISLNCLCGIKEVLPYIDFRELPDIGPSRLLWGLKEGFEILVKLK